MMKELSLILVSLAAVLSSSEALPRALLEDAESIDTSCLNPNGRPGQCLSISECETLFDVVVKQRKECYRFLQMSQCHRGTGNRPYVCCTSDTQFSQNLWRRDSGRIIFPGEVSRSGNSATSRERVKLAAVSGKKTKAERQVEEKEEAQKLSAEGPRGLPQAPRCGSVSISNRIFGGVETELNEFPWMVVLEYYNSTTKSIRLDCSGSLINQRYVLTAAHCVQGAIIKDHGKLVSVRVGDHNTETSQDCSPDGECLGPYQRFFIESTIAHPDYDKGRDAGLRNHNDIALLRLSRPVKFDDGILPVCLPSLEKSEELPRDLKLIVAGWGHNGTVSRTVEKRKVQLPFVPLAECRQLYARRFYVAEEQLCAGGIFKQDSCTGDSGGPLMRLNQNYWVQEGIVSFGFGCGVQRPGIYTNVRTYLNWIYENIN